MSEGETINTNEGILEEVEKILAADSRDLASIPAVDPEDLSVGITRVLVRGRRALHGVGFGIDALDFARHQAEDRFPLLRCERLSRLADLFLEARSNVARSDVLEAAVVLSSAIGLEVPELDAEARMRIASIAGAREGTPIITMFTSASYEAPRGGLLRAPFWLMDTQDITPDTRVALIGGLDEQASGETLGIRFIPRRLVQSWEFAGKSASGIWVGHQAIGEFIRPRLDHPVALSAFVNTGLEFEDVGVNQRDIDDAVDAVLTRLSLSRIDDRSFRNNCDALSVLCRRDAAGAIDLIDRAIISGLIREGVSSLDNDIGLRQLLVARCVYVLNTLQTGSTKSHSAELYADRLIQAAKIHIDEAAQRGRATE